jgi:tRNA A37 threonylcarbamoyltransferase TsaD
MPPPELCTDNAAMIAAAGYFAAESLGLQAATMDPSLGWSS